MRYDLIAGALVAVAAIVFALYLNRLWKEVLIDDDLETDAWLAELHEREATPDPRLPR